MQAPFISVSRSLTRSPSQAARLGRCLGGFVLAAACVATAQAQGLNAPGSTAAAPTVTPLGGQRSGFADGIVAVVDNAIITRRELDQRVSGARRALAEQNIPTPDDATLDRQVLDRMIAETVQLQAADAAGIRVDDAQIDATMARIAEQNGATVAQMRREIEEQGMPWSAYRDELRDQIRLNRLREQEVDSTLHITESEVDAFLAEQATQARGGGQANNGALALAQILIRVPEGSSSDQVIALRQRAETLRQQLVQGADFAQMAVANSDGEEALRGGELGVRPSAGWPELFLQAVGGVEQGGVSTVIQSGNGFHILKVLGREGGSAPNPLLATDGTPVTQTQARHILLRTSTVISDEQAREQLLRLRERIVVGGESFAQMARQYSNDASAPQGGDLGWLAPGETVPAFEQAMDALEPGQVSLPVQSPFGWHLIVVENRRQQDLSEQNRRMQARQILFQRKLEPAWVEWVDMLRGRAYVDVRLEQQQP